MICTNGNDKFLEDKGIWVATLSNNQVVYADDDRPGIEPGSAWIRLREYTTKYNLTIKSLKLKFRSNEHIIDLTNGTHVYLCRGAAAWNYGLHFSMLIVGTLKQGKVYINKWRLPELVVIESEVRENFSEECLIGIYRD